MPFPDCPTPPPARTAAIRAFARETTLEPGDFVYPMFFNAALDAPRPIGTMPGVSQLPVSAAAARGARRRSAASAASSSSGSRRPRTRAARRLDPDGPVPRAIAEMKERRPRARRHGRRVRRRVHRPRPLRRPRKRPDGGGSRSTTTRRSRSSRKMARRLRARPAPTSSRRAT